ncbi:MAG: YihY/virulence factor BrkB family protein [Oscillospiraceae bacterium]|nr:YihY/virulence factor BrkB family protein [Oscillospiraceae bacterium]
MEIVEINTEKHRKKFFFAKNFIIMLKNSMMKNNVPVHSAEAAFFIIIASLPTAMLFLTLLNYLPFSAEQIEGFSVDFLSPQVTAFVESLLDEVYQKSSSAVISVATITALWAASRGLLAMIRGLNSIYGIEEKRGFIRMRLVTMLYMLAFMITLIITLVVLVFGGAIASWLVEFFPFLEAHSTFFVWTRWIFGFCLLVLFFWVLYSFAPGRKTRSVKEFPGAFLCAAGWVGFSALYSFYINNFANYSYLYGSLTAIVLLMLWLYFCMNIMFFGAQFNVMMRGVVFRPRVKGRIRRQP